MLDAALQRRPAMAGLTLPFKDGVARVADLGPACRLVYRGPPGHLAGAFAVALPAEPCRSAVAGEEAALWLGPDEWLLIAPEARRASLIDDLRAAIGGRALLPVGGWA